jgi:hypothetical protein
MQTSVHYGPATTYCWGDGQQTTLFRCDFMDAIPAQFAADVLNGEVYSLTSTRALQRELRECMDTQYNPRHLPTLMGVLSIRSGHVVILRTTEWNVPPCEGTVPEALWWRQP